MGRPPSSITIRGVSYPSVKAAARAFGVSPGWLYKMQASGRLDQIGELSRGARMPYTCPVTIRGTAYASVSQAAAALGVTISAVSHAARRGTLDNVGLWK